MECRFKVNQLRRAYEREGDVWERNLVLKDLLCLVVFFLRVWFGLGDPMQEAGRMMKMKIYYLNPAGRRGLESKNSQ
jgi:hypothetical protein